MLETGLTLTHSVVNETYWEGVRRERMFITARDVSSGEMLNLVQWLTLYRRGAD